MAAVWYYILLALSLAIMHISVYLPQTYAKIEKFPKTPLTVLAQKATSEWRKKPKKKKYHCVTLHSCNVCDILKHHWNFNYARGMIKFTVMEVKYT